MKQRPKRGAPGKPRPGTDAGEPDQADSTTVAAEPDDQDQDSPDAESAPPESSTAESVPEQPDAEPARRLRTAALVTGRCLAAAVSVVVLVATAMGWATVKKIEDAVPTADVIGSLNEIPNAPPVRDGGTDILLVGSDSRTDAEGHPLPLNVLKKLRTEANDSLATDTIIVMRIPDNGSKASAISIPRDTSIALPNQREEKINSYYAIGKTKVAERLRGEGVKDRARIERESDQAGRLLLAQAVQELTGVRIDHYAEVNLYGFYLITEAVGGVEVCLKRSTSDSDSGASFRKGPQTISGGDALAFVRQRNGLPRSDLDRIVRQQVFMAAVVNKILSSGTLTDTAKFNGLLEAAKKSLVMDSDWNVLRFAQQMQGMAGGKVEFRTIPVVSADARNDRGQSVVSVDRAQVHNWVAGLVGRGTPAPPSSSTAPATTAPATSGSATPGAPRLQGQGLVRLDGPARQQPPAEDEPITAGGVTCVY